MHLLARPWAQKWHDLPIVSSLILSPHPARRSNSMCLTEFMGMTIFLQSLSSTFRAFDPQSRGQVTLSFNQAVYFVSNCT